MDKIDELIELLDGVLKSFDYDPYGSIVTKIELTEEALEIAKQIKEKREI